MWTHGVESASGSGYRVLSCRPTGPDSELSFVALGDLFARAAEPFLDGLPEPQREALEIAFVRRHGAEKAQDPRAAAVGTLGVLSAIGGEAPTIVAIDDVQWIDPATERVLAFAARRLSGEQVGFLLGRPATGEPPPLELADALPAERLHIVEVGPLEANLIGAIVRERIGLSLARPEIARLAELSGGNPFYALEIARARARGDEGVTGQRMPIPKSLREDLVRSRVGSVSSETRDALLLAASIPRPTVDALARALPGTTLDAALQQAIDAGIVEVLGLDVRFVHPLYRSAIYADASRSRRHEVHRRLAQTSDDPEERARHLALAAEGPDTEIAEALERAASSARAKGAPDVAAELLAHAVRLTPRDDLRSVRRRLLLASRDRLAAGDAEGAAANARDALRASEPGSDQAEPLRRIGAIEFERGALPEARAALDEALARTGDDASLAAEIHRDLSRVAVRAGEIGAAERNCQAALELADGADVALVRSIQRAAADVDVLLARPPRSFPEAPEDGIFGSPDLPKARHEAFAGDLARAEERLQALLILAADGSDEPGRLFVTTRLAELSIRRGEWERAATLATQARELAVDLGVGDRLQLALSAYAAAGRGDADQARRLTNEGLGQASGDRPAQIWCLSALGFLELSLARFPEALRHLARAGGLFAETGIEDPSAFPFLADEAEALVAVGERDTASLRIASLAQAGERLDRDLLRGQAERCHGLALAADGRGRRRAHGARAGGGVPRARRGRDGARPFAGRVGHDAASRPSEAAGPRGPRTRARRVHGDGSLGLG